LTLRYRTARCWSCWQRFAALGRSPPTCTCRAAVGPRALRRELAASRRRSRSRWSASHSHPGLGADRRPVRPRTAVLAGLGILVAGALISLTAQSLGWLVAGRAIQAFGVATGLVVARAIVSDRYPSRACRGCSHSSRWSPCSATRWRQCWAASSPPARLAFHLRGTGDRRLVVGIFAWRRLPETRPPTARPPRGARWPPRPVAGTHADVRGLRAAERGGVCHVPGVHLARALRDGLGARAPDHRVRLLLPVHCRGLLPRQLVGQSLHGASRLH